MRSDGLGENLIHVHHVHVIKQVLFRQIWDQRQGTADIYCTSASPWCPESSRFECLRRAKFIKFSRAPFRIVKGMLQVSWTCFQSEICPLSKFIQPFWLEIPSAGMVN